MTNNVSYTIAMNIYRALGGQQSGFESVEDVYAAVDEIYSAGGGRIVVEPLNTTIKGAGKYVFNDNEITGYKPVEINVDVKEGFNFGVIGYNEDDNELFNGLTAEKIAYSKSLYDAWDKNNTSAKSLYENDENLYYAPAIDTSKVTNMSRMFYWCKAIVKIPQFDTSKVTDMSQMFNYCSNLTSIPQLDTSKVATMYAMFDGCSNLTSIPQLDTSNVWNMSNMFNNCNKLTTGPKMDTSKVANINYMFGGTPLTSLPKYNFGNVGDARQNYVDIFGSGTKTSITNLGGFEDLGKKSGFKNPNYFLKNCPNLTKESVMNVINNLYDRASAGYSVVTLPFHANSLALLSDNEIAIATNKGWILT